MKKIIICLILSIVLSALLFFSIYFGLKNNKELNYVYAPKMGGLTYEFSGKSQHFSFDVGKVFLSEGEKSILLDYFRQTKKIKNLKNITITILLDGEEWQKVTKTELPRIKKRIDEVRFYEGGYACKPDSHVECEHTQFSKLATEYNFKNIFSVNATYCLKNNKCKTETFKIEYKY